MQGGNASNFGHLQTHDEQLVRLGMLAERYFAEDPNTCLLKLRQLAELLAQLAASNVGIFTSPGERQVDLLRRLHEQGIVPREVGALFAQVRKSGNDANHSLGGDHRTALLGLRLTWQLGVWFHRTFKDPAFKSGPFLPPAPPAHEGVELKAELDTLRVELAQYRATHQNAAQVLDQAQAQIRRAEEDRAFWENMATEAESAKSELLQRLEQLRAQAHAEPPPQTIAKLVAAANSAAAVIQISEGDTRKLIDAQLASAGWTVDSALLTFAKGARPQRGQNFAIAEWPTETGPADYALFIGLTPVAIVEAKRRNIDVSAALQQATRYSRGFRTSPEVELPGDNFGANAEFRIPFVFSTNGRPYLRQLAERSGVWFCDLRRPENLGHALDGWYSPEGLSALMQRDEARAHAELANAPFDYGFPLRPYQQNAILATEASIHAGQRAVLLAMATGTGKTKTCIALIYRLLKAKRFRRILFLVDRSALGEQAANAFKDTRMERLQTFADIFGIKELDEPQPDADTAVHLATIQGMVQRVLYTPEGEPPPPVDQYDCIVVDECHRGYSWLAFDIDNFRLAGVLCNTLNQEYSEETVGKGDWFPLLDPSKRAKLNDRNCGAESPTLLDPVDPDDPCKLLFKDDGTVWPDDELPDDVQANVTTAIECLGLRQSQLNRARKRVWIACNKRARQYSRIAAKPKGQRTAEEATTLAELAGELIAMGRSSSPFAAVARTCLIVNRLSSFVVRDELIPIADAE